MEISLLEQSWAFDANLTFLVVLQLDCLDGSGHTGAKLYAS
jgi:hypothetical protein